jgi:hypothetical protein
VDETPYTPLQHQPAVKVNTGDIVSEHPATSNPLLACATESWYTPGRTTTKGETT